MAHTFKLNSESLKREYAVYVVIIRSRTNFRLYVGKTGDNREGCNPIISRCGNHFSYNKIHSQVRNKIENHQELEYTYVFDHFGGYPEDEDERRDKIDQINEMERWLNLEMQKLSDGFENCAVENIYKGTGHVSKSEKAKRKAFHTKINETKIMSIVSSVSDEIRS
ncbi:MAG: hypothetical protein RPS47_04030 [Colwellia sp.]|jgi:hypothetical protein